MALALLPGIARKSANMLAGKVGGSTSTPALTGDPGAGNAAGDKEASTVTRPTTAKSSPVAGFRRRISNVAGPAAETGPAHALPKQRFTPGNVFPSNARLSRYSGSAIPAAMTLASLVATG